MNKDKSVMKSVLYNSDNNIHDSYTVIGKVIEFRRS